MEAGYFYSKSTGLYVAREPLKIDARVIKAAADCGIKLKWDDEGRINFISFYEGLYLLQKLGATMLTLRDYWRVLKDAKESNDVKMAGELQSGRYAEWLNTIFEKKESTMPFGHPGWFNAEDIDYETGFPGKVELNREKYSTTWKYWSFCDYKYVAAAVRGWVTSVGKPSLDLGIPADAVYPLLMLRECLHEPLQPSIDSVILEEAERLISSYESLIQQNQYEELYGKYGDFLCFFGQYGELFQKSQETRVYRIREKITEILGILRIIAARKSDGQKRQEIGGVARRLSQAPQKRIEFQDFVSFIQNSRTRLRKAVAAYKPIVFVMGHKNPDTDTVVSALAEAYRNHLATRGETAFLPVVQGKRIPDETERLLGKQLSGSILLTSESVYQEAARSGQARWIMVDHNKNSDIQRFAVAIIDHHAPSEIASRQNVAKTLELVGSTTCLVVQKIKGLGVDIPKDLARILYGAALMDTENRSELKMTSKDGFVMDDLKETAAVPNDNTFYQDLMGYLLNTDFAELLFKRDYKEDWAFFGFAVAKVKKVFDAKGRILKRDLLQKLTELAQQNNKRKNLPLTIVKVVDYKQDNETINRERIYLIFNDGVFPKFKETMFELIETIIDYTFKGRESVKRACNFIEFWGTGDQLSRKRTAPILEPIAVAFNQYFFSPTARLFVKRDFLRDTKQVRAAVKACGIELSRDEEGRINNIAYGEAMKLLSSLGFTALSLKEYWQILKDAEEIRDQQMVRHLQSSGFAEFLHTVIENNASLVEKPEILESPSKFQYEGAEVGINYDYQGKKRKVEVPDGKPGLIHPEDIDLNTGLPKLVLPPNIYDDPSLWRYWSPDAEKNVATRSHIFLIGQPALDLKVHLSEAFHCLGVRPCCEQVALPEVKIITDEEGLSVVIKREGEVIRIKENDFFAKVAD